MSKVQQQREKIGQLVAVGLLAALIVVFQTVSNFVKVGPVSITLTLIPVVLGGCLLGRRWGAVLGFVFGLIVTVFVLSGTDTYKLLQKSKESFSWAENYTVTDRTVTPGDFIPLGENSFFCTVDYTANLKKYSYKTVQSGTFRILMVKSGGVFKVGGLLTETK